MPITDTSSDLPAVSGGDIQGISPLAMPVWQMVYSAFGPDLANGYEARPTTINNNFKPDLWEWVGLPAMGGADDWSWHAGGGNGLANGSVLTAPVLSIRYPGQYHDAESGLLQNWWRSYDPRMGRYTQNDPIGLGGGMNRFGYVEGDPLGYTDSMGLATEMCTRKLNSLPFRFGDLYHQYVCVPDGKGGKTCGGLGPKGNMFDSPGVIEFEPKYKPEACEKVADENACLEKCIRDNFNKQPPNYSVNLSHGANCQTWANSAVAICTAQCKGK